MTSIEKEVDQPFLHSIRSKEEIADYIAGFQAGWSGKSFDMFQCEAWRIGWMESKD
jgi:hypothetical protein